MEDDTGLELSLGLSFGGSSINSKGKNERSLDIRTEEGNRASKSRNDFNNYLQSGFPKQDTDNGSQRSDSVKSQENFFHTIPNSVIDANGSLNLNGRGQRVANTNRSAETEEDKILEVGNKRRIFFNEINHQKKRERESHHADLHDKARTSRFSITTEDGSTAENEDVAESEVEGSTSRLASHHEDGSKLFIGAGGSSEVPKEVRGFTDSIAVDLQAEKRFISSSENEFKSGNLICGIPFSIQPVNVLNGIQSLPVKESVISSSTSTHPLAGMVQVIPAANSDRSGTQPVTRGNLPIIFGYSPVQLPVLDKDNSWGSVSHSQQLHPSIAPRGPPKSAAIQVMAHNPSEASQFDAKTLEWGKGDDKQHAKGQNYSFQREAMKESNLNFRSKDAAGRAVAEGVSLDFSAIKPGLSAEIKFGGHGSYPDLPWVSTTGPGPNGRTISGVTYRYNANQIRIVCACHGSHMSPEEFVRHAAEEHINPDNGTGLATVPSTNPAASAQS